MSWFVKVEGRVYGPYTPPQMRAFVGEGRIAAHSMVSADKDGNFTPASNIEDFKSWFGDSEGGTVVEKRVTPGARPANFVIITDIKSENSTDFRASL